MRLLPVDKIKFYQCSNKIYLTPLTTPGKPVTSHSTFL